MKHKFLIGLAAILLFGACKKQLDYTPTGVLSSTDLTTTDAAEGLVTAAYAAIGNGDMIGPIYSNWAYGSVRSDDAYKGGGGTGDFGDDGIAGLHPLRRVRIARGDLERFGNVARVDVEIAQGGLGDFGGIRLGHGLRVGRASGQASEAGESSERGKGERALHVRFLQRKRCRRNHSYCRAPT